MSLKRCRFIERDFVFQKLRGSVRVMSDEEINTYLDEVNTWRDLTLSLISEMVMLLIQ